MNIIKELRLRRPIYQKTARFGHFGKKDPDFTWETPKKIMKLKVAKKAVKKAAPAKKSAPVKKAAKKVKK